MIRLSYNLLLYFSSCDCLPDQTGLLRGRSSILLFFGSTAYILSGASQVLAIIVVQLLSCVQFFGTPRTAAHQSLLSFTISLSLVRLMSIAEKETATHSTVLA